MINVTGITDEKAVKRTGPLSGMYIRRIHSICFAFALVCCSATFLGCTEYWWTRGQPPSPSSLVEQGQKELAEARRTSKGNRETVAEVSRDLEYSLTHALRLISSDGSGEEITEHLESSRKALMTLEGKVSYGSRAPLGELAGQLRKFLALTAHGEQPEYEGFALFTARTLSLLATELTVPSPSVG